MQRNNKQFHLKGIKHKYIMGKGDKKSRRGKIHRGTYGVRRKKIKRRPSTLEKISIDKKAKA
jgi:30S ribosomal protein S31